MELLSNPLFLWTVAIALVAIGVGGTFLPMLPGIPVVLAGLILAAWIDGFQKVGWLVLALLGFLTIISYALDIWGVNLGARSVGASKQAAIGASIGMVIGFFFGIPGIIFGAFIGAFIGELIARKDILQAGKVGLGTWFGLLIVMVLKFSLVFSMIGIFVAAYFI